MKNVKKIRQLTMRLKMQWKILIGVLVSGVAVAVATAGTVSVT